MQKELAVDYFDRHKSSNECHITSDGRVFHTKGSADGFANGLKDTKVKSFTRAELEPANMTVVGLEEVTGNADDLKAQAIDALRNFDASTAEYPEIKALVKALGLETPTQKQPDLLAAIEVAKANLEPQV